jgi:hypothetical protein
MPLARSFVSFGFLKRVRLGEKGFKPMINFRQMWSQVRREVPPTQSDELSPDDEYLTALLRDARLEPVISEKFESDLLRRHRVDSRRAWLVYWTPAAVAAGIAALAFFAMIQSLTTEPAMPTYNGQEARLVNDRTVFPDPRLDAPRNEIR